MPNVRLYCDNESNKTVNTECNHYYYSLIAGDEI